MIHAGGGETLETPLRAEGDLEALDDLSDDEFELEERSLQEDVEALIDDGKIYLEAELQFQKTRAAYVADRVKGAVVYGAAAAAFAIMALIGLTVGLIIALSPVLTPWGASGLVVGLLILFAVIFARLAGKRWKKLMAAIDGNGGRTR